LFVVGVNLGELGGGDKEIWKANEGKGEGVHKLPLTNWGEIR